MNGALSVVQCTVCTAVHGDPVGTGSVETMVSIVCKLPSVYLLYTSSFWPEIHSPQHDTPNLEVIGLFVTPFWALIDLEFGETELRGGCGCACGGRFSEGVWSSTAITHVLLGQVATDVRDLLMGLGAPEGKAAWGGGRAVPTWPNSSRQGLPCTLALLSPPFRCKTYPSLSFKIHSLISKELTGEADLLV